MNVSLTPELEKLINDQVKSGLYEDASEVVRDAIRRAFCDSVPEPAWLQEKIADGVSSSSRPVNESTWKRIAKRGREKLAHSKKMA